MSTVWWLVSSMPSRRNTSYLGMVRKPVLYHQNISSFTPPSETMDLCTREGQVKGLNHHLSENGSRFFKLREICLVVRVHCELEQTKQYIWYLDMP